MRKKPYTTKEFFDTITEKVLDAHPDIKEIIDYSLASSREQEIRSDQFPQRSVLITAGMRGFTLIFVSVEICQEIPDRRTKPSTLVA